MPLKAADAEKNAKFLGDVDFDDNDFDDDDFDGEDDFNDDDDDDDDASPPNSLPIMPSLLGDASDRGFGGG